MTGFWRDLQLGARRLLATPLFLIFAVVSLSLGIAVTTAVYSVLYAALWQPLDVKDPQRVMFVTGPVPGSGRLDWRTVMSHADFRVKFQGWDEARARHECDVALDAARGGSGIESVSASSGMPFGLSMTPFADLSTPDKPIVRGGRYEGGHLLASTPDIFRTLGVQIVRGRAFDLQDQAGARPVAVISEHGARALFGSADAIGREAVVRIWARPPAKTFAIIGVARDTDTDRRMSRRGATLYVPLAQHYEPNLVLVARTSADPAAAARILQMAVRKADPDLSTGTAGPATMLVAGQFVAARVGGMLAAALGLLTLTLSMIGLYGVQSHIVARRTREVGVRMALGASDRQIERMILREGFTPVVQGFVLGLLFGVLARLGLRALIVSAIEIFDPIAFSVIPVVLFAAAFFACYMPARRAAHVDPNVALRQL